MCTHSEQGTQAHLWSDEHAGLGKALHVAALVTNSNEASLELERCRFSTGLWDKKKTKTLKTEKSGSLKLTLFAHV